MTSIRHAAADPDNRLTAFGLLCVAAYLGVLGWAMGSMSFDVWGALIVVPVLVAITLPIARHIARLDRDASMFRIVMGAFALKLFGSLVRYAVAFDLYGGAADAATYDHWGRTIAPMFRSGDFSVDITREVVGTGFLYLVSGAVYTVTGPTKLGGFLVFSWLGFLGLMLFYRAFRIGFPQGDRRRYALLLFFLPSLLFWPSSIGKEAWMMLTLGMCAYGCARMLARGRGGALVLGVGLLGTALVRPHVTLVVFVAVFAAFLLRRSDRPSVISPVGKLAGIVALLLVGAVVVSQVETFFGVDRLDQQGIDEVLVGTQEQTETGGSEFEAPGAPSPVTFPRAVMTVMFRPWPFEASNGPMLLASLEGTFLLVLVAASWRRIAAVPRLFVRVPYIAFVTTFSVLFIFAFANIGNFGIVARERVQLFPLVLVLLALPIPDRGYRMRRSERRSRFTNTGSPPAPDQVEAG